MTRRPVETPNAIMRRLRTKLLEESTEVAIDALTKVADDDDAPAPARSAAGSAILRDVDFSSGVSGVGDKEAHEMSAEELEAAIARLRGDARTAQRKAAEGDDSVFD